MMVGRPDRIDTTHWTFGYRDEMTPAEVEAWNTEGFPGLSVDGRQFLWEGGDDPVEFRLGDLSAKYMTAAAQRAGFAVTYGTLYEETFDGYLPPPDERRNLSDFAAQINYRLREYGIHDLKLLQEDNYGGRLVRVGQPHPIIPGRLDHPKAVKSLEYPDHRLYVDGFMLRAKDGRSGRFSMVQYLILNTLLDQEYDLETGLSEPAKNSDIYDLASEEGFLFEKRAFTSALHEMNGALGHIGFTCAMPTLSENPDIPIRGMRQLVRIDQDAPS